MKKNLIRVPVLLGPTASGKTDIAIKLALEFGWEILSCDSRQIYRFMDIGTAKPTTDQLRAVKHWLVDIIEPSERYSAFRFAEDSLKIIRDLAGNSKTVLVCGGTGMYFRSLSEGLGVQVDSDPGLRDELMERGRKEGSAALHAELMEKDPETALKLHPNDLQRIVRALIVFYQSGEKISGMRERRAPEGVEFITAKLVVDREMLYDRINRRVEEMVGKGLYNEFLRLRECGYGQNSPGLQCVGYKELFGVERGEYSLDDAVEQIKRNTRRYAKRQITWFTHQTDAIEIPADDAFTSLRKFYRAKMFLDCCD